MREQVNISEFAIGRGQPTFIIAEIGVNHNGSVETALKMIDKAAETGVDCIKFQTFTASEFVNSTQDTYEYVSQGKLVKESMAEMFQRLELKKEAFAKLFARTRELGILPLSTPTDIESVEVLEDLGAAAFKIGSDDLVYTQFLDYVARKQKPMIISTGMANAEDVERAVRTIEAAGNDQLIILHCVSLYPTPEEEVNLRKISTLKSMFDCPIGFSDHSWGITAALGAVALGATVLEKHFTLDCNMPGPDHRFSADPEQLASLVTEVRRLEKNIGRGRFCLSPEEQRMADLSHRSVVIKTALKKGQLVTLEHLAYRRPGTGLPPHKADALVGKKAIRDIPQNTMITELDLVGNND